MKKCVHASEDRRTDSPDDEINSFRELMPEVVDELIDIAMSSGQGQMYIMF